MEWEDTHTAGRDRPAEEKRHHLEGVRWVTAGTNPHLPAAVYRSRCAAPCPGGDLYQTVRDWYRDTVNHSVVVTGELEEEVKAAGAQLIAFLEKE